MLVQVKDGNMSRALRQLKRRMEREGLFTDMHRHDFYEKPSERRNREEREAKRKAKKQARRRAKAKDRSEYEPHHVPGGYHLRADGQVIDGPGIFAHTELKKHFREFLTRDHERAA